MRLTTTQGGSNYYVLAINGFWARGAKRFDLAEITPAEADDELQPGDVVVIENEDGLRVNPEHRAARYLCVRNRLKLRAGFYHHRGFGGLAGVVNARDKVPVALNGRVKAKVRAENGAIKVSDLLTTSSRPGNLIRCLNNFSSG